MSASSAIFSAICRIIFLLTLTAYSINRRVAAVKQKSFCLHLNLPIFFFFFFEIKDIQERHKWCSKTLYPRSFGRGAKKPPLDPLSSHQTPCRNFAYTSIWPQLRAWSTKKKKQFQNWYLNKILQNLSFTIF